MKKITLTLLLLSALFGKMISQPIVSWNAPPNEQAGSNFALASGGNTAVYHRAAFLIKNSELAPVKIASQTRKSIFTTPVTGDKDGLVSCSLCGRYEIFNNLYNLIIE